jgi:hypothetical protein
MHGFPQCQAVVAPPSEASSGLKQWDKNLVHVSAAGVARRAHMNKIFIPLF